MKKIKKNNNLETAIAIVGIACKVAGADDYQKFWQNLQQGVNSIREIPPQRWNTNNINNYYSNDINEKNKTNSKWAGLIIEIDKFDNDFFNISPREARSMSPQQRLLLEETYHCIEDSAISLTILQEKKTNVYCGVMTNDYIHDYSHPDIPVDSYAGLGNYDNVLANRISYFFGLTGASLSVNTACASSLTGLHLAKQALLLNECHYAIISSVNINSSPWKYLSFGKSRMLSPDGQCKTFDVDANGYVPGDGICVLMIQRLKDAQKENNYIYGIVKGTAINHMGKGISITAPKVNSQQAVIQAAYREAGINPREINYIEAHGTGTSLGDPIEIAGLTKAFRPIPVELNEKDYYKINKTDQNHDCNVLSKFFEYDKKKNVFKLNHVLSEKEENLLREVFIKADYYPYQYCHIGSVKTNIGHLEASAGLAGLIKILMMMKYQQIPKSLNVNELNPMINWQKTPFSVALNNQHWLSLNSSTLKAGVSSFGFGGVNSHALLESYPSNNSDKHNEHTEFRIFMLSAKSEDSLKLLIKKWQYLLDTKEYCEKNLNNILSSLAVSRPQYNYRVGFLVCKFEELKNKLFTEEIVKIASLKKICLVINNSPVKDIDEIYTIIKKLLIFNEHFEKIKKIMKNKKYRFDIKHFEMFPWQDDRAEIYSFIFKYCYLSTLIDLGLKPDMISGSGDGLLLSLVLSGILSVTTALEFLFHKIKLRDLNFKRPSIPFYNPIAQKIIKSFQFDYQYLNNIIFNILNDQQKYQIIVNDDVMNYYLEKSALLLKSQFSFKKYLNEWTEVLKDFKLNIYGLLKIPEMAETEQIKKQKFLLLIIIISSWYKLNQKWDLDEIKLINNDHFYELLDLIIDNVLMPKDVVQLIMQKHTDFDSILDNMNKKQHLINPQKSYKLLRSQNLKSAEIIPLIDFYQGKEPYKIELVNNEYDILHIGNTDSVEQKFTKKKFYETLLHLWKKGFNINWHFLNNDSQYQKLPLPTYPFQKKAFWIQKRIFKDQLPENKNNPVNKENSIKYLTSNQSITLSKIKKRMDFSLNDPIIQDHVITGTNIIPAASFINFVYHTLQIKYNNFTLHNFLIQKAVIIKDTELLEIEIDELKNSFQVYNHDLVCYGNFNINEQAVFETHNLDFDKYENNVNIDDLYAQLKAHGYHYGRSLRVIKNIKSQHGQYIFELTNEKHNNSGLAADLLDGIFQTVLVYLILENIFPDKKYIYVPYFFKEINFINDFKQKCYVVLDQKAIKQRQDDFIAHLKVYDQLGQLILHINEMLFKRIENTYINDLFKTASITKENIFYKPVWQEITLDTHSVDLNNNVIIFNDQQGVGNQLAKHFSHVFIVNQGKEYQEFTQNLYEINPENSDDYKAFFKKVPDFQKIYYLWGFKTNQDIRSIQELNDLKSKAILPFFRLCKTLAHYHKNKKIELIVITSKAQLIQNFDQNLFPYTAPLIGINKVMGLENKNIITRCIDIDPDNLQVSLKTLICENQQIPLQEIAYRGKLRYVRILEQVILPKKNINLFKKQGVYLIAGGAGGIGFALSSFLAEKYQAKLILIGRKNINEAIEKKLAVIKQLGGEGLYFKADITNLQDMQKIVQKAKQYFGSLNGVVNSTLNLADSLISKMSEEQFRQAFEVKYDGSFILSQTTINEKLDFIVFFSSVLSLQGNEGQCNYVAGCCFKDAYNYYLNKTFNINAVTINWGYWGEVGIVADNHFKLMLQKQGIGALTTNEGLEGFLKVMQSGERSVTVAKIGSDRFKTLNELNMNIKNILQVKKDNIFYDIANQTYSDIINENCYHDLDQGLDQIEYYGLLLLLNAFQQNGLLNQDSQKINKQIFKAKIAVIDKYSRFFDSILDILSRYKIINLNNNEITVLDTIKDRKIAQQLSQIKERERQLIAAFPDKKAHIRLLSSGVPYILEILNGRKMAVELLFPGGSFELIENFYHNNSFSDFHNRLNALFMKYYLEKKFAKENKKIRILEVGAGTGGTTAEVLKHIAVYSRQLEYYYTDISYTFLNHGKKRFQEQYPFIKFAVLNIETDLHKQKDLGKFDIIFGTNVIHATGDLNQTFKVIKELIVPGGCLILNELCQVQDFLTLSFGLLDGWWLHKDDLRLPYSPLLSPFQWENIYQQIGFNNIVILGDPSKDKDYLKQAIIIGNYFIQDEYQLSSQNIKEHLKDNDRASMNVKEHLKDNDRASMNVEEHLKDNDRASMNVEEYPKDNDRASTNVEEHLKDNDRASTNVEEHLKNNDRRSTLVERSSFEITQWIKKIIAEKVEIQITKINDQQSFFEIGIDSIIVQEIAAELNKFYPELTPTILFEKPNVTELADYLKDLKPQKALFDKSAEFTNVKKIAQQDFSNIQQTSCQLSDDTILDLFTQLYNGTVDLEYAEKLILKGAE